jgi:hypothetical protein
MIIKKTLIFFVLILIMFLPGCNREEDPALEKVQFAFNAISSGVSGGKIASGFPEGTTLLLSLEKSTGESVYTKHPINLVQFGESSISEPLELPTGTYRITDFMLADKNGAIQYAAPKRGSPLANVVVHSLPYSFTVSKNKVTTIDMEVVGADQHTPEDFGYVSFSIHTVNTFSLSVFAYDNGKASLTGADVYIIQGPDTISRHQLDAKVNRLPFAGDPAKTYELVIMKSGYGLFTKSFVYTALQAELAGKPLTVNLTPAFTLTKYMSSDTDFYFEFAAHGKLIIDWGDRSVETFTLDGELVIEHRHGPGNHFITVTGDIDKITLFHMFYDEGLTREINFTHLVNLQRIEMGETVVPETMDLSQNKNLFHVSLISMGNLKHILLPDVHRIRSINISSVYLAPADIDAVIGNIYRNAVQFNLTGGSFDLKEVYYEDESEMLGPPSAEGLDKLRQLRDLYQWQIEPNP